MSRVDSNYARKDRDLYETPGWVVEALIPHLPEARRIWEPACGRGNIVRVLADNCYDVHATDIVDDDDFFDYYDASEIDGIVTNPPYTNVALFVMHAVVLVKPRQGFVAMLLSADFDSAVTRRHLFADCPMFAKTIVLTKRIVWFERSDGKKAAPSENHRWFIWDWKHKGPPTIGYAP